MVRGYQRAGKKRDNRMGSDTRIYQLHVTLSRIYDTGEKIGKMGMGQKKTQHDKNRRFYLSLKVVKNDYELPNKNCKDDGTGWKMMRGRSRKNEEIDLFAFNSNKRR